MNLEKRVKIRIPQSLSVFPILFLIYISRVVDMVTTILPKTISLFFIDDLRFLVGKKSIHKVAADLQKIEEVVLR